jgi:large subunit ribosomal protein L29
MSKASQYRDQSVEELEAGCEDLYKQLFQLRSQVSGTGARAEKPHLFRETRKNIARIHTILREKKQG